MSCIFCKIIQGEIPCFKLYESTKVLAFLDIGALSDGHALVIPKHHAMKMHDIPDDQLAEMLPTAKKIAKALGNGDPEFQYNLLQNNGRLAHQQVDHVHLHIIPKPSEAEGLGVRWNAKGSSMDEIKKTFEELKARLE
ncbi:hit family 1 [Dipodascopsis tothii]|uniref:hit family 1 n=1 Tax=Dipodascopsis tothii TaxID=44089 RepID=UPI0034CDFDD1